MATIVEPRLFTAEDFSRLPENGRPLELVRGRIVEMNRPFTSHGYLMYRIAMLLGPFVEQLDAGRMVVGDAGVITRRNPDSVRGPDVAFYSFQRIPRGPLPEGYWPASPELVIEILSPDDCWKDVLQKVAEYLNADVLTVAVIDPVVKQVRLFLADREPAVLHAGDSLMFPDVLPGFEIAVSRLFE